MIPSSLEGLSLRLVTSLFPIKAASQGTSSCFVASGEQKVISSAVSKARCIPLQTTSAGRRWGEVGD